MRATALLLRNTVSPRSSVTSTAWGSVSSARRRRMASELASATASAARSVARSDMDEDVLEVFCLPSRRVGAESGAKSLQALAQAAVASTGGDERRRRDERRARPQRR